jgi:hypothetical protein
MKLFPTSNKGRGQEGLEMLKAMNYDLQAPCESDVINGILYLLHASCLVDPEAPIRPEFGAAAEYLKVAIECYIEDIENETPFGADSHVPRKMYQVLEVLNA